MTFRWHSAGCAALALGAGLATPGDLAGQRVRELGPQVLVAAREPVVVAGGLFAGLRTTRRTRLALTAGVGGADGETVWRGELLGHFLLNPGSRRAPGLYAGGGIALSGGPDEEGNVVILVGLEGRPGARSGWALEAGLGGGFRATAGYRWRWFGPP
jgi:hypothetical protein